MEIKVTMPQDNAEAKEAEIKMTMQSEEPSDQKEEGEIFAFAINDADALNSPAIDVLKEFLLANKEYNNSK